MTTPPALEQISISLSLERDAVTPASSVNAERCARERKIVFEDISKTAGGAMTFNLHERMPPFHVCITNQFADHVRQLHRALDKALIDIVDRWWSDVEANFPAKMPLEPHEEELLRWIDELGAKHMSLFRERYGMWRTDYLIERFSDGKERAKVCEINARIPFNGFWGVGMQGIATRLLRGKQGDRFVSPDSFEVVKRTIAECFDKEKPLYLIRERWPGVDSHLFQRYWQEETGRPMKTVKPSQLRVRDDPTSPTGQTLYFVPENGSVNDRNQDTTNPDITQCAIELFQEEFGTIDMPVLQQLATCCTNDIRNVLFIHDKRLLQIVREQLPNLVKRNILTHDERTLLEGGIVETILTGTPSMNDLLQQSTQNASLKDNYIIKPVRGASCNDIRLGRNITQDEWLDLLTRSSGKALRPSEDAYIIQPLVDHIWYDIVTHDEGGLVPEKLHLIGAHHVVNSKLDVFGPWRLGREVHMGFKEGTKKGLVMCSVLRPEGMGRSEEKEV